ncbi:unnamed protein product, partial [Didymodactylos carnosus]
VNSSSSSTTSNHQDNNSVVVPIQIKSERLLSTDTDLEIPDNLRLNLNSLNGGYHSSRQSLDGDNTSRHSVGIGGCDDNNNQPNQYNENEGIGNDSANKTQTCFRDREIHNRLEKHRRAHLKDCFDHLKTEVPCQRDRKVTNLQILNMAIKYIQTLTRKEREYEQEIQVLSSRHVELQRRLKKLKDELNQDGHDVDQWLDACSDADRSTSTNTASEAEMYRSFDGDLDHLDDDNHNHDERRGRRTRDNQDNESTDSLEFNEQSYSVEDLCFRPVPNSTSTVVKPTQLKQKSTSNHNHQLQTSHKTSPFTHNSDNNYSLQHRRRLNLNEQPAAKQSSSLASVYSRLLATTASTTPTSPNSISLTSISATQPSSLPQSTNTNILNIAVPSIQNDIRYDIVDLFTKGTISPQTQSQMALSQISPLPSIASLMRSSLQNSPQGQQSAASPSAPSPTIQKHTIGINTDNQYLITPSTNLLTQQQQPTTIVVSQLRSTSPSTQQQQSLVVTTT